MSGFPHYTETAPIATKSYGSGLSLNLGIALLQDDDDEQERTKRPQLDLLSFTPCPHSSPSAAASAFWTKSSSWPGTSQGGENRWRGGIDMNQMPDYDDDAVVSSPNSTVSSFHADNPGSLSSSGNKRDRDTPTLTNENDVERASSRLSDEEEGDNTRKKLRLSKEQSTLLEESFKKHNTLNPKQKIALAKQLNLRPRQVEVWFQNRRARTKLKQTEVDCEFLKRCCENLTEENRRLQKEVQELRALKICSPYLMQMAGASAATLTMCPSCERVATADTPLHRPLSSWQPLALPLPPNSSRSFQPPVRP